MFRSTKSLLVFLAAVSLTFLMFGCANFDEHIDTEKLIVQVATMKVIEAGDTSIERHLRAQSILSVASDARTWLSNGAANLGDLRIKLEDRVNQLQLAPSDRILAYLLIDQILVGLNERVVDGLKLPVPPDQFVYQVNTVLSWVEGAAKLY